MSKQKTAEYISNPTHCPFCGSDNIYAMMNYGFESNYVWSEQKCECGKMWKDIYTLTKIEEIKQKSS